MPANHRLLGSETGEGGVCSKLRAGVMRVRGSDDPMSQRSHIEDLILRLVSSSEARGNQPWNGSVSPPKIRTAQTSTRWEKAWGKFPSCRFARGSYSSERRPRSFRRASKRSNDSRASFFRPSRCQQRASQKELGASFQIPRTTPQTATV